MSTAGTPKHYQIARTGLRPREDEMRQRSRWRRHLPGSAARTQTTQVGLDKDGVPRIDRALMASIEDGMVLEVPGSPTVCEVCWNEPAVVLARDLGEAGAFLGESCGMTWFHGWTQARLSWPARSL
jgi:hypothetical protein